MACFWIDGHHERGGDVSLSLEWRTGITAKDWESVAKKEKIEVRYTLKLRHTLPRYVDIDLPFTGWLKKVSI